MVTHDARPGSSTAILRAVKTRCPHCGASVEIAEQEHYKLVTCPSCKKEFQAFGSVTERLSKEFLDELRSKLDQQKKKP